MTAEPALLARRGRLLERAMRRERVAVDEVLAAVRQHGRASLDEVEAVVLETDGSLTVIERSTSDAVDALQGVRGVEAARAPCGARPQRGSESPESASGAASGAEGVPS